MARLVATVVTAMIVSACVDVDQLEIEPKEVSLKRKNEGTWLKCIGKNRAGHVAAKVECTWRTGDEKIAVVDKNGKLQGRASGVTTVYARAAGFEAEAAVRIEGVERIEVDPKTITFNVGDEPKAITVKAFTYADHAVNDRAPEFKTQNADVAAIADGNMVFPGQPGETNVNIYVDDVKYELPVTVLPKGKGAASKGHGSKKGSKKGG
jgi:hypothetical protein